ncbi:site-specific recombinase, phage integrase family [Lysobacter capsici]|nr:site-specific recombinase, phage integrase family [Lysobacter capsici]
MVSTPRHRCLIHGDAAVTHPTKRGAFGDVQVSAMTPAVIQTLVEDIAKGRPESRPGAGDARRGYPSKANHVLRYLRRLCAWGVRHGHCQNNPGRGVKQTKERKKRQFPKDQAYVSLVAFARERGQLKPHSKGSQPPYLAAVAEIAFSCRLRGVEVCDLNDADILAEGLQNRRRKGSLTNITAWNPRLQAAVAELQARRTALISAKKGVTPMRAEDRPLLYGEDGAPLARSSLHSAWKRLVAAAVVAGVIAEEDTFAMHGLKRRGISNTEGTRAEKKDASGHATEQAFAIYDDEIKLVPAPVHPIDKLARAAKKTP